MSALKHLADRVTSDPFFFAHAIAQYLSRNGLTLELLAAEWGVTEEQMTAIRLCGVPATAEQCQQIADRFGVGVGKVREVMGM